MTSQSSYHLPQEDFLSGPEKIIPGGKTHSEWRWKGEDEDFCFSRASLVLQTLSLSPRGSRPPGSSTSTVPCSSEQSLGFEHPAHEPLHPSAWRSLDLSTLGLMKAVGKWE